LNINPDKYIQHNLAVADTTYNFFNPKNGFDIYQFQEEKIVEQ
jgi:predicted SnoaL-like aldol condensation-catalyzing enzyme